MQYMVRTPSASRTKARTRDLEGFCGAVSQARLVQTKRSINDTVEVYTQWDFYEKQQALGVQDDEEECERRWKLARKRKWGPYRPATVEGEKVVVNDVKSFSKSKAIVDENRGKKAPKRRSGRLVDAARVVLNVDADLMPLNDGDEEEEEEAEDEDDGAPAFVDPYFIVDEVAVEPSPVVPPSGGSGACGGGVVSRSRSRDQKLGEPAESPLPKRRRVLPGTFDGQAAQASQAITTPVSKVKIANYTEQDCWDSLATLPEILVSPQHFWTATSVGEKLIDHMVSAFEVVVCAFKQ